ncbi:MAG TPA: sensor histidine kinase [Kribbellaceae bacterium]|nr:sensor histidine kinase [Kribbellaceae bacterium]
MRRARYVDAGVVAVLAGASLLLGVNDFLYGPINRKVSSSIAGEATRGAAGGDTFGHMVLLWWGFAVLCALGIMLRRRWPLAAVGLAAAGSAGHLPGSAFPAMPLDLALPIALYTLAVRARSPWHSRVATGVLVIGAYVVNTLVELLPDGWPFTPGPGWHGVVTGKFIPSAMSVASVAAQHTVFGSGMLLVLAFALGEATRLRRAHVAVLEQRAADLERERDHRSALAISAERARITRELHDVVAHGLSVVVIQAQGASAALRSHPDRAERALGEVITTGRSSLAEIRRLLGVVRRDPREDPGLAPQPGVGALPALVDQVRAVGTEVAFQIDGEPAPLPTAVDLSAYRIVQEALTNVLKHAGTGGRARVRIGFTPRAVQIEVTDDGTGPPPDDASDEGHGLRGIAERVGMLGGEWSAGARPDGGFALHARLPLAAEPTPAPAPAPGPAASR